MTQGNEIDTVGSTMVSLQFDAIAMVDRNMV